MKRFFSILIIAVLFSSSIKPVQAQDANRWDARVGLGVYSIQDMITLYALRMSLYDSDLITYAISITSPNIEMSYECNSRISVGAQLTLGYSISKDEYLNKTSMDHVICPTLMANLKANYFKINDFSMYGLLGLGVSTYLFIENSAYLSSTDVGIIASPMINFYPLCFSTNKDNGFFMELGLGSKGLINLGWEIKL